MKYTYIFFLILTLSCGSVSNTKSKEKTLKVLNISEFANTYGIETINTETNKLNYIVSYKESYFKEMNMTVPDTKNMVKIVEGQSYNFQLTELKPIVGQSSNLGAYIIIKNDTLQKKESYKELPISFIAHNTLGKLITKKN